MTHDRHMLLRLERGFRATAAHDRQHVGLAQFDVFLSAQSGDDHSLAIPSSDGSAGIDALVDAFAKQGRRARVEYFHELYPALAAALEGKGFELEMDAPVMTLEAACFAKARRMPGYKRIGPGDGGLMEDSSAARALRLAAMAGMIPGLAATGQERP